MPEGAARTIQEDSKTKTHPLINCQFSTQGDIRGHIPIIANNKMNKPHKEVSSESNGMIKSLMV